jgi:chemotaxis protein CheC
MQDELDILREVGSIAAAHGSIALSEMLGRKIELSIPSLDIVFCTGIPTSINVERMGIAIISRLPVGLKGEAAFLLDEKNAFKFIDMSYKIREEDKKSGVLTEIGISSIKEIGSIVINTYLSALSIMFKRVILPLPPTLVSGTVDEILNILFSTTGAEDYVLLIEAVFEEPQEGIKGGFYLVLTPKTASDIRKTCKKMLKELEKK